ncbi:MAG: hypothetical protein U0174_08130 [Polyangiaceae bacterium]
MNSKSLLAVLMTTVALAFGSGCAVETHNADIVVPERPTPDPTPVAPIVKKTSTSELRVSAHDEATLVRLASTCSRSSETTFTITFCNTQTWDLVDHERVVEHLGALPNVKLVFEK